MNAPQPSRIDPTPEERKGDSSFLPVVIAAGIALIVILIAAIIFIKARQTKTIPTPHEAHPTSEIQPAPMPLPVQPPSNPGA
jgi:cell division protein FtsN